MRNMHPTWNFAFISILLASVWVFSPRLWSAEPADATQAIVSFDAANKLYEQGKFMEAAAGYQRLLESGRRSVVLYFNLGNARFKAGQVGRPRRRSRKASDKGSMMT